MILEEYNLKEIPSNTSQGLFKWPFSLAELYSSRSHCKFNCCWVPPFPCCGKTGTALSGLVTVLWRHGTNWWYIFKECEGMNGKHQSQQLVLVNSRERPRSALACDTLRAPRALNLGFTYRYTPAILKAPKERWFFQTIAGRRNCTSLAPY